MELLDAMTQRRSSTLVAKRNLFQLASETMSLPYEEVLHTARFYQLQFGRPWDTALLEIPNGLGYLNKMRDEGYLQLEPVI